MTLEPQIRPLEPRDRATLRYAFNLLSPESRWMRFLGGKRELSERDLARLLDVDHWHHEALLASTQPVRAPIAVARYVRSERFDVADIAVAVADPWQRQGVGRTLTVALRARARLAGIRAFTATVQQGNQGALALADELGRRSVVGAHGDILEIRLEL